MNQEKKKKIAVIGSQEFTLGFELAGISKTYNPENYADKIQELVKRDDLGILVTEQGDMEELPKRVRGQVESSVEPVVVTLSETAESERMQEKIKKAIGADIT
ncbi:V-type ATP synthase subunit F [Candidatus Nanohalobium constans]|uniref:A-type ATP synthase subunit F n=1 Tax=Candidatus Nanohalobium constans TaxID=2565781 RepID=A0A5Q0UGL4_9ARCH|nr:V-type ATP synthase subunit F [Candidatus Nanohalobium constans]QGA80716.1 V/A-type H+/Na+-transporting ATPase subunit F [Candidatus Nanohalobium constans]